MSGRRSRVQRKKALEERTQADHAPNKHIESRFWKAEYRPLELASPSRQSVPYAVSTRNCKMGDLTSQAPGNFRHDWTRAEETGIADLH